MTGATGLIGSELGPKLIELGHTLVVVTRKKNKALENLTFSAELIECDLNTTPLDSQIFAGVDAVINLAGETIDGRWTVKKKKQILDSREQTSINLLINCPSTVKTIVTASAQGFYGERGEEVLTETSIKGSGFLAQVCKAWESKFLSYQKQFPLQRLVILRLGMVLTKKGGALKKLISIFKKNIGATLGSGEQWMSYASLEDITRVFIEATTNEKYSGIINASNNNPVRNSEFTKSLCKKLNVIQLPRVPSFALKFLLGEMSELVLTSTRVEPVKLNELGFKFKDDFLDLILNREIN